MLLGLGELAALATAVTWGMGNQIYGAVCNRFGSSVVTVMRAPFMASALLFLCMVLSVSVTVDKYALWLLVLSSVAGMVLGDLFLYKSVTIIGPTMAVLTQSTSSGITAIAGWVLLREVLPPQAIFGICVTIAGVVLVVTEHSGSVLIPGQTIPRGKTLVFGVLLAFGSALGLAAAYILQRMAMKTGVDPLWAACIRTLAAWAMLWSIGLANGWTKKALKNLKQQPAVRWVLLGACTITALGLWFASAALQLAPAGIAATIISLQPIVVALIGAIWYRRRPSLRVMAGAVVAFFGTALVCLR